jgi:hypothetical protein
MSRREFLSRPIRTDSQLVLPTKIMGERYEKNGPVPEGRPVSFRRGCLKGVIVVHDGMTLCKCEIRGRKFQTVRRTRHSWAASP